MNECWGRYVTVGVRDCICVLERKVGLGEDRGDIFLYQCAGGRLCGASNILHGVDWPRNGGAATC